MCVGCTGRSGIRGRKFQSIHDQVNLSTYIQYTPDIRDTFIRGSWL